MKPLGEILVELGTLSQEDLARALKVGESTEEPLDSILTKLGLVSERDRAKALSVQYGLPLASPDDFPEAPILGDTLSLKFLREAHVLPLAESDDSLTLAVAHPGDGYAADAVRLVAQKPVKLYVAAPEDIQAAIERLYSGQQSSIEELADGIDEAREESSDEAAEEDIERLKDLAREAPVVRLVNKIIADAIDQRASDIHIEPFRDQLKVRFRVDGLLREVQKPPARLAKAIVSRIKVLAHLNIAERRLPQDGRARFAAAGRQIDLRIATMPTIFGESVVIRLLDDAGTQIDFSSLGLASAAEKRLRRLLSASNGMLLVTGPTGSGKTTLLYAALRLLNTAERKILTVEDPIEYQIAGINQIQVKPAIGLGFADVLRSIVRHDPDVIMVGEMRDTETADIAVHAALTGHLVLTTLHTNSAAGSITRLLDMGVDSFLLTSTIRGAVAQRLVRRLCDRCKQPYQAPAAFTNMTRAQGLLDSSAATLYRAVGCETCSGTGFIGRIGIFELLEMSDRLRALTRDDASTDELDRAARQDGMTTMVMDGLKKCLLGVTTIEEVLRVTEAF